MHGFGKSKFITYYTRYNGNVVTITANQRFVNTYEKKLTFENVDKKYLFGTGVACDMFVLWCRACNLFTV